MDEHLKNGVDVVVPCADETLSRQGAWLLDASIPFEILIPELQTQDASRTPASCFQHLGAIWDEHWFDRVQRISPGVETPVFCPDVTRSMGGAWMLPGTLPVETLIQDMKAQNASRTTADCFQLLGGVWINDHFVEPVENLRHSTAEMKFYYLDPVKTHRTRLDERNEYGAHAQSRTGVEYSGGWLMTKRQKAVADRLKEGNPDWHYAFVADEGGRTADEIVGLDDEDQSLR